MEKRKSFDINKNNNIITETEEFKESINSLKFKASVIEQNKDEANNKNESEIISNDIKDNLADKQLPKAGETIKKRVLILLMVIFLIATIIFKLKANRYKKII